jgi:hypothetical protein
VTGNPDPIKLKTAQLSQNVMTVSNTKYPDTLTEVAISFLIVKAVLLMWFHNTKKTNLYFSQITIRTIKSRRMRWEGHVAPSVWVTNPEGKRLQERLRLDGGYLLKWNLKKEDGGVDWIQLVQTEWLSNWWFLKKDSAPWS